MTGFRTILFTLLLVFGPAHAAGDAVSGVWELSIRDPQGQVKVEAKVTFTDKSARSCISGDWKVVTVLSVTTKATDFFPINTPLAYKISDGQLTLGRTEVCDGYLFLSGRVRANEILGDYYGMSIGSGRGLGTFWLRRQR